MAKHSIYRSSAGVRGHEESPLVASETRRLAMVPVRGPKRIVHRRALYGVELHRKPSSAISPSKPG
jgi:hypothetical protein